MSPAALLARSTWSAGNVAALGLLVGSRPNTMMAGADLAAVSALAASTGPLESEGGRWWPPVGDFELAVAVWPAVARLGLGMVVLQSEPSSRYRCSDSAYRNIVLLSSQSGQIAPKIFIRSR